MRTKTRRWWWRRCTLCVSYIRERRLKTRLSRYHVQYYHYTALGGFSGTSRRVNTSWIREKMMRERIEGVSVALWAKLNPNRDVKPYRLVEKYCIYLCNVFTLYKPVWKLVVSVNVVVCWLENSVLKLGFLCDVNNFTAVTLGYLPDGEWQDNCIFNKVSWCMVDCEGVNAFCRIVRIHRVFGKEIRQMDFKAMGFKLCYV